MPIKTGGSDVLEEPVEKTVESSGAESEKGAVKVVELREAKDQAGVLGRKGWRLACQV